jgi:sodium-dependent dicarboxylate transporter 2/3/5
MFENFIGYNLEESRRDKKNEMRNLKPNTRAFKLIFCTLLLLVLWNLPSETFGIPNLTIVEQRVIAVFCYATFMWILEAIPAWTTSVSVIVIVLVCASDSSLWFFSEGYDEVTLGTLLSNKKLMACFADPIIMLFIGGFVLAIAATKTGLDAQVAKVLLKPFGKQSVNVLLGFLLITGFFSMFVSNTVTAALMLTFLTPVFKNLPENGKGRIALAMSIPVAANLDGMATPISTPPNALAFSTNIVKQNDMMKVGIIMGIISLVLGYATLMLVGNSL